MSPSHPRLIQFLARLRSELEARGMRAEDVVAEAREHLEDALTELSRAGMSSEQAIDEALRRFGPVERVVDAWCAQTRLETPSSTTPARSRPLADLLSDARCGFRKAASSPGFAALTLLILATGIGATTAMFSLVSAVLLRPLPFREPERLVRIALHNDWGEGYFTLSDADYVSLREHARTFETVAAVQVQPVFQLTGGDEPIRVRGALVTAEFFQALGVDAPRGRVFQKGDDRPGGEPLVLVSDRLWRGYLKSNAAAVGSAITIDGRPHTIVGVVGPELRWAWTAGIDVWPILRIAEPDTRAPFYLTAIGRLKPGVARAQVEAELDRLALLVKERYPASPRDWRFALQDFQEFLVGGSRPALFLLFGAVALLLLMACANVASLLLARAVGRQQETAIRVALGASTWRLVRQLVTESLLLAGAGGLLGVLFAAWGLAPLTALAGNALFLPRDVALDTRILGLATALAAVTLTVGLMPALRGARGGSSTWLKEGGRTSSPGLAVRRLRSAFTTIQVTLATVLLVTAGLVVRSLMELQRVESGAHVDEGNVLTISVALPEASYPEESHRVRFWQELLERVRSLAGVEAAASSMSLPPDLLVLTNPFSIEGRPLPPDKTPPLAEELLVSPGVFETLGIALREGRDFALGDGSGSTKVLVVNETLVKRHFPDTNPVGRRMQLGDPRPDGPWYTIVGVVADVKYQGLDARPSPTVYVPYYQESWWPDMYLVVRSAGNPVSVAQRIRAEAADIDPTLALGEAKTLDDIARESIAAPRFRSTLLLAFAILALTLAAMGVCGVMAHAVLCRHNEIAVRRAVGASDHEILLLVIGEGMKLVLPGAAAGILLSIALSRVLSGLLFDVSPVDPVTLLGVPIVLALVAWLACIIPARRALRVDPLAALKV